jgi:diphthamide synthase (EF-2-diphthine--ammonia ligase)
LSALEPLWGSSTSQLFEEWVASGSEAVIVTARAEFFDETWVGRRLDRAMAEEFTRRGVDPCGERGEYHTIVTAGRLFSSPLHVRGNGVVQRSDCWALDLVLADVR